MSHPNARLEALSDGVFAIAMTLLILDVHLPSPADLTSTAEVWRALGRLTPSAFAFVLSFLVILITWVNHHAMLKTVTQTSAVFIYANGFLLLTVIAMPFPAQLLGDFVLTDHAAPAVVLYNAILAASALGWILVSRAALRGGLVRDAHGAATLASGGRNAYMGLALYIGLAVVAVWLPLAAAAGTTLTWIFWLVFGLRQKHV